MMFINNNVMTVADQEAYALKLLDTISIIDPDAIVAGGAPRDWHYNRLAKDLDIFIVGKQFECRTSIVERLQKLGFQVEDVTATSTNYLEDNRGISGVFNLKNTVVPAQIIYCSRDPRLMIYDFMVSISKIYMNTDGQIYTKEEFRVGDKFNCIFVDGKADMKYVDKIVAKYPRMKVVFQEEGFGL